MLFDDVMDCVYDKTYKEFFLVAEKDYERKTVTLLTALGNTLKLREQELENYISVDEALAESRNIPRKPNIKTETINYFRARFDDKHDQVQASYQICHCPACDENLGVINWKRNKHHNYCSECGQKLDWNGVEHSEWEC